MRSMQKAAVGGGFALLAMAGVASSVAFACTAEPRVTVNGTDMAKVPAGAAVFVEARGFSSIPVAGTDTAPPVNITWNGVGGLVLGTVTTPSMGMSGTSAANVWAMHVAIPKNATPSVDAPYYIHASQVRDGKSYSNVARIYVEKPASTPAPAGPPAGRAASTGQAATSTAGAQAPAESNTPSATGSTTAGAGAVAPSNAPAVQPVAASNKAPITATGGGSTGPVSGATPDAAFPLAGVTRAVDPSKPVPTPPASDMWTGLDKPESGMSLLDSPTPATPTSGFPAGAALLGMGVLALAGAAAMAGQQRLVKVTRS